mgnify:CR=1 FL=1
MTHTSRSFIVGLAGGSASGKSTLAAALTNQLASGPNLTVRSISTDAYFLPDERIPRFRSPSTGLDTPDYNRPDSIDVPRLTRDLREHSMAPNHPDVILLEGLMVLHLEEIRALLDLRVFIELEGEKRALRRLVRNLGHAYDPINRHDPASIANYYLESAWVGHEKYIEPSRRFADLIVRGDGDFNRTAALLAAVIRSQVIM